MHTVRKEAFAKKTQILQEVYLFFSTPPKSCISTYTVEVLPHPNREAAETHLIPLAQTALFNLVSMRTSGVPISFMANLRISLRARGARFLKPLQQTEEPFLYLQETVSIEHLLQHTATDILYTCHPKNCVQQQFSSCIIA